MPTYACVDTGDGTDVVFEGTLEERAHLPQPAPDLRINLGKRSVELRVNGKPVTIPDSPEPIGFDFTRAGTKEIAEGTRPCA